MEEHVIFGCSEDAIKLTNAVHHTYAHAVFVKGARDDIDRLRATHRSDLREMNERLQHLQDKMHLVEAERSNVMAGRPPPQQPRICSRTLMGVGAPHTVFSRGGTLLPFIYADARYIDAVIVSKLENATSKAELGSTRKQLERVEALNLDLSGARDTALSVAALAKEEFAQATATHHITARQLVQTQNDAEKASTLAANAQLACILLCARACLCVFCAYYLKGRR